MRNITIIALIFIVPILAYTILTKGDANSASKTSTGEQAQIIKFTSLMCIDCKKIAKSLDKVYPKYSDKIELIEVHVQDNNNTTRDYIKKYNVTLVPTMIFLDKKGKVKHKTERYLDENELEKYMKELTNG
jgi:thioredoxin 1